MDRFVIAVQARMNSRRLPGKTLYQVAGKPLLGHLLAALGKNNMQCKVYVLTSRSCVDQAIVSFCEENEIPVRCGAEDDVASRFLALIREVNPVYVLRISADSPLLAPEVVNEVLHICSKEEFDMVTTVSENPYPSGMHVEAIRSCVFEEGYANFSRPEHFEHVIKYFYEHDNAWSICKISCSLSNVERYKFSCDTRQDLDRIEKLFGRMVKPHYLYSLQEKIQFYRELFCDRVSVE